MTDRAQVRAAFDAGRERFGGVDIVVSNAGAAWQGRIGEVSTRLLRKSFELNFFAHQTVAQEAVRIMLAQGTGGCLLFNTSKQAVNPGADFGPYGLPKAATLFLMRQYALDYGADGIRSNAVNADRIRTGLLTDEMIASASRARGCRRRTTWAATCSARGHRRGRGAGLRVAGQGARDHRPYRDGRRRQHRRGSALRRTSTRQKSSWPKHVISATELPSMARACPGHPRFREMWEKIRGCPALRPGMTMGRGPLSPLNPR